MVVKEGVTSFVSSLGQVWVGFVPEEMVNLGTLACAMLMMVGLEGDGGWLGKGEERLKKF